MIVGGLRPAQIRDHPVVRASGRGGWVVEPDERADTNGPPRRRYGISWLLVAMAVGGADRFSAVSRQRDAGLSGGGRDLRLGSSSLVRLGPGKCRMVVRPVLFPGAN